MTEKGVILSLMVHQAMSEDIVNISDLMAKMCAALIEQAPATQMTVLSVLYHRQREWIINDTSIGGDRSFKIELLDQFDECAKQFLADTEKARNNV